MKKKRKPSSDKSDAPGLAGAFALALQPNYLGSPEVVGSLVSRIFEVTVDQHARRATYEQGVQVNAEVASAFASDEAGYTRMPGWHTSSILGNAIIESFNLDVDYYKGENLFYLVSEGLCGVSLHISEMLKAISQDPKANWNEHALPRLNELFDFVVAVLLGTNSVSHPGKSLKDFSWMPVS